MSTPEYMVINQPLSDIRLPHGATLERRGDDIVVVISVGAVVDGKQIFWTAWLEGIHRALLSVEALGG